MSARRIRVRGVVQGVGFRPFVYRLAKERGIRGWVRNGGDGVEVHAEGHEIDLDDFASRIAAEHPPAAVISALEICEAAPSEVSGFTIVASDSAETPSVRISPDLPVCAECLAELFDPEDRRYEYPYINCTNCGPRFTVVESLPYDRPRTTMRHWPMDPFCADEYRDPLNRRFHAQPVACPECGPHYSLETAEGAVTGDAASIAKAAEMLRGGSIVAVKGIGGFHLSCDARNAQAVGALRQRKFRKEKPFAVMVRSVALARELVELSAAAEALLLSAARPIVLAPAKVEWSGVAPGNHELGVMLPYAPLHFLLFEAAAPEVLVMTSANRSSEPIAYLDEEARERLEGIADAFLIGERPIARRVDDSVVRAGVFGPTILRRSRGYAPGAVTEVQHGPPVLAVGADLKNTITLIVDGQAFVSQHIGDLDHYESLAAFQETIRDFVEMYRVRWEDLVIAHDLHPQYASTLHALGLPGREHIAIQHHRAHITSVLAETRQWDHRAVGISFDGTGYGDDGSIWGGEFFTGSVREGWKRALHLRNATLPGGDAAARFPVQCAAGFLSEVADAPDPMGAPFHFPARFGTARQMIEKRLRTFQTSSMGRLFDTVAALLGFTREISFEGQAAIWLEQLARTSEALENAYPFPAIGGELDFRPLLGAIMRDRVRGVPANEIARSFHCAVARETWKSAKQLCEMEGTKLVVLSGGVFQNELLLHELRRCADGGIIELAVNRSVPSNDGGISLGQAFAVAVEA